MLVVRVATPDDSDAVAAVLQASYPVLMAPAYPADILRPALSLMTRPNPALLACGTFFVAVEDGILLGCGGWTPGRPDMASAAAGARTGHIRQFAVRADRLRRGVGRALIGHTINDAAKAGIEQLDCASSLVAVEFYRSAGFVELGRETINLVPGVPIETVAMKRVIRGR